MHGRFQQLYRRRLYLHHYKQYIDRAELDVAGEAVAGLADAYRQLGSSSAAVPPNLAQLRQQGPGCGGLGPNSLRQEQTVAAGRAAGATAAGRRR